jgi:hypothetical protein
LLLKSICVLIAYIVTSVIKTRTRAISIYYFKAIGD